MTLCLSPFLLTALFSITYWLRHHENSNFRPFVFNKVTASFMISVLRVSWTYCRREAEDGNGQADSLAVARPGGPNAEGGEKEGGTWGRVAYSGITRDYSALA